jgi:hypothetical protein
MHSWAPIQTSSLVRQLRPWADVCAAGHRGWLGTTLYDAITGEILNAFPDELFNSADLLADWSTKTKATIDEDSPGRPPLASFKIQPPGWVFREFSSAEAPAFRQYLESANFGEVADTEELWRNWQPH